MYRLLSVIVLVALALPAAAQSTIVLDPKDCHGDPFTLMGKRVCWGERDNAIHPVKGKPPRVGPWLKLSFSSPVGPLPTYNAFDPTLYEMRRDEFGSRQGLREGDIVTNRTLSYSANVGTSLADRSWGVRARVVADWAPIVIDVSWTKAKPYKIVQVWSSEFVTTGRYYEDCPSWAGTQPCIDFGGKFDEDTQYNEHRVQLHVFRAGVGYDLLNSFGFVSLEPAVGIEWSLARVTNTVSQKHFLGSYENAEVVQDRTGTAWLNGNSMTPYASLTADVYPFGKDRWLSLGVTTRYLLTSGDWKFQDGTLLGPYEVPIRSRRWSTSLHATLAF